MMCRHVKVLHTEIIPFSRHYSEQAHNEGALGGVGGTLKKKLLAKLSPKTTLEFVGTHPANRMSLYFNA